MLRRGLDQAEACGTDEGACTVGRAPLRRGPRCGARAMASAPAPEVCNGLDDDCDGVTDENLGIRRCGRGVCDHEVPACMAGVGLDCDPFEGATPELCNGLDDDCDGVVDPPPCGDLAPLDWSVLGPILGLLLLSP
jgi:Notch-like protein